MKNMYAISLGLSAAGIACVWIDRGPLEPPSFELTAIGYLLGAAGLMLLLICLGATVEECLRSPRRRAFAPFGAFWRRR